MSGNLSLCIFAASLGIFSSWCCAEVSHLSGFKCIPSFIFALCLIANAGMKRSNFSITFLGEVWVCAVFALTRVICISSFFYKTWCGIFWLLFLLVPLCMGRCCCVIWGRCWRALLPRDCGLGDFVCCFVYRKKIFKEYVNIDCFHVAEFVSIDRDKSQAGKLFQPAEPWLLLERMRRWARSLREREAERCHRKVLREWEGRRQRLGQSGVLGVPHRFHTGPCPSPACSLWSLPSRYPCRVSYRSCVFDSSLF